MSRTRLLILDDHNLFRESLGRFLAIEPDLEVVGNCSTSKEALELLRTSAVDLVLLDFDLEHELGSRLGTSEGAIKATVKQLFDKPGVRTRGQLVRVALEWSLAEPGVELHADSESPEKTSLIR